VQVRECVAAGAGAHRPGAWGLLLHLPPHPAPAPTQLYDGSLAQGAPAEDFNPDFDMGVNYNVLRDDQMPTTATPRPLQRQLVPLHAAPARDRAAAAQGAQARVQVRVQGHERAHGGQTHGPPVAGVGTTGGSVSRRRARLPARRAAAARRPAAAPLQVRPATNLEALSRSWATRAFSFERVRSKSGLPFPEEDAQARLVPRAALSRQPPRRRAGPSRPPFFLLGASLRRTASRGRGARHVGAFGVQSPQFPPCRAA